VRKLLQLGYDYTNQLHVTTVDDKSAEMLCIGTGLYGADEGTHQLCMDRSDLAKLVKVLVEHCNFHITRGETVVE
jgi:hypothetical protein